MDNIVGKRIKELRMQKNMTVDQLAEKVGKSRATIYRYENGEIEKAPYTVLVPFANALGTTPTYLLGLSDEKEETQINSFAEKVGQRIQYIRTKRGLSIAELAEKTNITKQQLIDMENGIDHNFDTNLMLKFCEVLNVDKSYFVDISEPVDDIGENIKALRKAQNLSMTEVAKELHIGIDEYKQLEEGKVISYDLLDKLANIFNINVAMLIGMDFRTRQNETNLKTAMRILQRSKQWHEVVGETVFTDEEMNELMDFAKYLISKRRDKL